MRFYARHQLCQMETDVNMPLMACNNKVNSADAPCNRSIDNDFTSGN